jgi:hypothetical protein
VHAAGILKQYNPSILPFNVSGHLKVAPGLVSNLIQLKDF